MAIVHGYTAHVTRKDGKVKNPEYGLVRDETIALCFANNPKAQRVTHCRAYYENGKWQSSGLDIQFRKR